MYIMGKSTTASDSEVLVFEKKNETVEVLVSKRNTCNEKVLMNPVKIFFF